MIADSSVIILFALIDEHPARVVAKLQGIKCTGSIGIFLAAFNRGLLSENEAKTLLNTTLSENFRVSAAIVAEFYDTVERIKKTKEPQFPEFLGSSKPV